jgi:hypothetical protein
MFGAEMSSSHDRPQRPLLQETPRSTQDVHQTSNHANDGENDQAHDEQVFHHPLTALITEEVNHS